MGRLRRWVAIGLAAISAALLVVSAIGDLRQLTRHPQSNSIDFHKRGIANHRVESAAALGLRRGLSAEDFTWRVAEAIVHYGTEGQEFDSELAYGFFENYPIFLATRLELAAYMMGVSQAGYRFAHIERFDPDRILQKGVGFCGQVSILLARLLTDLGYEARAVGLDGHVVVEAVLEDGVHILDADYNVTIAGDLETLSRDPERVAASYRAAGMGADRAAAIARLYGPEGNQTYLGVTRKIVAVSEWLEYLAPLVGLALAYWLWGGATSRRTEARVATA